MFKKLNFSSPLGIALTVAGLVLALSPEARRSVRKWMVKGTAGVMDTMEQVGGTTAGVMKSQPVSWKSEAEVEESSHGISETSEFNSTVDLPPSDGSDSEHPSH